MQHCGEEIDVFQHPMGAILIQKGDKLPAAKNCIFTLKKSDPKIDIYVRFVVNILHEL